MKREATDQQRITVEVDIGDPELMLKIEQSASDRGMSVSAFVEDIVSRNIAAGFCNRKA